jgi:hypothetical protein
MVANVIADREKNWYIWKLVGRSSRSSASYNNKNIATTYIWFVLVYIRGFTFSNPHSNSWVLVYEGRLK